MNASINQSAKAGGLGLQSARKSARKSARRDRSPLKKDPELYNYLQQVSKYDLDRANLNMAEMQKEKMLRRAENA